ncbi:hypothetical protein C488_12398 [Natrinema pellirubrum DSM 15624]|uniref:Type I restriction enzyme R protein N-terminal domain-containing protein n=1 Tax=Natrinema pellirubrum (strain DSM 15624 / CIP 106293 / JCM 10476 / NCIMB 786 / 157) TaxID=797303 RepID=L0JPD5_NATP1|nr:hypothetical protein [Natrinema pellirubrum]AGB32462.1 hypothetical protein Natpe_2656 [Natrinema pellirubrum DSM 15624]ELY73602.1 hypothetical protein C488_12398 [Natrinema pellirubrum DSM 15624]
MPPLDIRSYTARAGALVDASPPTTLRDTRRWLVDPLLETLGWDVRADSCRADRDVDDVHLEYVPTVDSVPALFVAVEPATDSLDGRRANALRRAMAWTGVGRAIYTNGRDFLLLAGTSDIDYRTVRLADLTDEESVLANYTRSTLGSRLERHSRELVARQLAVERPVLVESIVDRLTAVTTQGEAYAPEFEAAAERFLDQLVVAFAEQQPASSDGPAVSVRFSESAITDDGPTREGTADSPTAAGDAALEADDPTGSERDESGDGSPGEDADTATDDRSGKPGDEGRGDGEYVVRFFNERGSIGAIGHSTSDGALVEAAEYLLDRGLAGVDPPWRPDGSDRTILNDGPVGADGSPMAAPKRLSNGLALETAGSAAQRAARVKALADRAGLRAMLTGDWDRETQ